jgi:hypothetical protein
MSRTAVSVVGRDTRTYDFDLHGVVGIRLVDATARDRGIVARQLGPLGARLSRTPDITVRFVDRLPDDPVRFVGLQDCGFNQHGFFVLRARGNTRAKALLAFDEIGNHPRIVCERAMPAVPHLIAAINLTALAKGVLPLHASAFTVDGAGVLVTGWAKGGKTESLLAALRRGGTYVGDEWVYLTPDRQMLGLPEPIRLWAWHLDQLPELLSRRSRTERVRLATWQAAAETLRAWSDSSAPGSGLSRRAAPIAARQAYLQVPPTELFGAPAVSLRASLDAVVLVLSHSSPETTVSVAGPTEVSGRMIASLADERAAFMAHYRQFRFAFPDRASDLVETAPELEAGLLRALFDGRPAHVVAHPHPCDIAALGDAVLSAADTTPAVSAS